MLPTEDEPRGLGDTPASFSVSPDGEARYTVPLWVPPGRAGLQPSLALVYGSRAGNGQLGVGWHLAGTSQINRCRRTLAQDGVNGPVEFSQSDAFCLDGVHLVPVATGGSAPKEFRPNGDPTTRVLMYSDEQGPDYFEVYTRDGRVAVYGAWRGTNSRLEGERTKVERILGAPSGSATDAVSTSVTFVRYSWAISEVRDRTGNYMRWIYAVPTEYGPTGERLYEHMLLEIQYTGFHGNQRGAVPNRKITFEYETRPDRTFQFVAGLGLQMRQRLTAITMSGPGLAEPGSAAGEIRLRQYRLRYDNPSVTGRSLLHSIQECDGSDVCRVPIEFDWEWGCGFGRPETPELTGTGCSRYFDPDRTEFEDLDLGPADVMMYSTDDPADEAVRARFPEIANFWTLQTADIDGDGRDDILFRVPELTASGGAVIGYNWYYRLSTGRRFGPRNEAGLPRSLSGASVEDLRIVDLDGDGKAEVVSIINADPVRGDNGSYEIYRFDESRFLPFQPVGISQSESFQGWWRATDAERALFPAMHIADLNGDGRPELVRSTVLADPSDPDTTPQPYRWGFRAGLPLGSANRYCALGAIGTPPDPIQYADRYCALGVTSGFDHAAYTVDWNNDGTVELLVRDTTWPTAGDAFSPEFTAVSIDQAGSVKKTPTALSGLPFELSSQMLGPDWCCTPFWPSPSYYRLWFIDVNGDGLPDAVAVREREKTSFPNSDGPEDTLIPDEPYVAINSGNGFKPYERMPIPAEAKISPALTSSAERLSTLESDRSTTTATDGWTCWFRTMVIYLGREQGGAIWSCCSRTATASTSVG